MKTIRIALAISIATLSNLAAANWVDIDVIDSRSGRTLPEFARRGDVWLPGYAGAEFKLRLRNTSGERVLAVISIDGVNVLSGETAAAQQGGYVLDPYQTVTVDGWRKNLSQTAAFYFSDFGDSYAARTNRPLDVGVIGLAVFREARRIPVWRDELRYGGGNGYEPDYGGYRSKDVPAPAAPQAESLTQAPSAKRHLQTQPEFDQGQELGTGHGRRLYSSAREVSFQRRSATPDQVTTMRYDSLDALIAQGIVPPQFRTAQRGRPRAFPGGFVPDPAF